MRKTIFGILAITFLFLGVVKSSVYPAGGKIGIQEISMNS